MALAVFKDKAKEREQKRFAASDQIYESIKALLETVTPNTVSF